MTERQKTEPIALGFSVADASSPRLNLADQVLTVTFTDWREQSITLVCQDTVAVRWQEAERQVDNERDDDTFVVSNSTWLAEHESRGLLWGAKPFRHLKLNFNAAGTLEVLCTTTAVEVSPRGDN